MVEKIGAAAALVAAHFPLLAGIVVLAMLPISVTQAVLLQPDAPLRELALFGPMCFLLAFGLGTLSLGALLQALGRLCLNEEISVFRAYRDASETWDVLVVAAVVVALLVFGGFLLLILPGLYLMVKYLFVAHVVTLEGLGIRAALKRSWQISNAVGLPAFGVLLLFALPLVLIVQAAHYFAWPVVATAFSQVVFDVAIALVMLVPQTAVFLYFWEQREQEDKLERLPEALLKLERDYRQPMGAK